MTVKELLEKIVYAIINDNTRIVVADEIGTHKVGNWMCDQITWYLDNKVEMFNYNLEHDILVIDLKEN